MANVAINSVVKRYGSHVILPNLSLDIEDGEFCVLVGPSGCGKSTLLRMIAGLESISDGTVSIDGHVVNDRLPSDRDIAMVFQDYALYPHMNVKNNLSFAMRMRGDPAAEIEKRVSYAAKVLQIEPLLERKPKALSGGQRQRVAMGRAIVREPKVFLFDEPLSNLDAKLRVEMRAEIKRLHQRLSATMIYVTHDQVEAMTLADKIVVLRAGHIEQLGTPAELYRYPATTFVASFIGSPAMNLIPARLAQAIVGLKAILPDGSQSALPVLARPGVKAEQAKAGTDVLVGLRPEDLELVAADAPDIWMTGWVDVVEPLGAEALVLVKTGPEQAQATIPLTVRSPNDCGFRPGERVGLRIDASKCALFDAGDGQAIGYA
ncbi:sn-glycerol-3-phosphate ABC transporter ATP-binding protein UgpC [Bosea caraganae]|uniref:sn-glycerol-3-phosphate ABC transporter ATP-binding protein UgpC n=1 Tax=Bosea caraganae TaxID=2763117 RepID=A0A370L8H3_9HYPH|nr:sn-glycerol-3-phosphate ABC transporter ATP-binding protein UgpC [Bosea caraganae]RDJ26691.1 sn-glycerol-3-phosphate ABC transporter ATP-binding protein UgpC [Bosea caraganae]RDJ30579.1 sn-glycerol-3-phosphate ABC transporter ATP-binding protein UgpC [Bosea caraganae]